MALVDIRYGLAGGNDSNRQARPTLGPCFGPLWAYFWPELIIFRHVADKLFVFSWIIFSPWLLRVEENVRQGCSSCPDEKSCSWPCFIVLFFVRNSGSKVAQDFHKIVKIHLQKQNSFFPKKPLISFYCIVMRTNPGKFHSPTLVNHLAKVWSRNISPVVGTSS